MKESTYRALRDIVHAKAGISLGGQRHALVQARVSRRLRELGLDTVDAYLERLRIDPDGSELVRLLDAISTNTTSFFRESEHFRHLSTLAARWKATGLRKVRIWCAAASTGEEPWSIAMTCLDVLDSSCDLRILATDINTTVLRVCHTGTYHAARLEPVPAALRHRFFEKPDENGNCQARPELRARLRFARLNLAEVPYPMKGPFDAVFCRNVMIYFDAEGRAKFFREARRLIAPGGVLYVGHAESVAANADGFRLVAPSVLLREEDR